MPRRADAKPLDPKQILAAYNERQRQQRHTAKQSLLSRAAKSAINSARCVLTEAVFYKRVSRPVTCSDCGINVNAIASDRAIIEAHIPDYRHPLDVIWLCHKCNKPRRNERIAAYKAAVAAGGAVVAGIWVGPLNRAVGHRGLGALGGPVVPLPGNVAPWKTLQAYSRKRGARGQGAQGQGAQGQGAGYAVAVAATGHAVVLPSPENRGHDLPAKLPEVQALIEADMDRYLAGQPSIVGSVIIAR